MKSQLVLVCLAVVTIVDTQSISQNMKISKPTINIDNSSSKQKHILSPDDRRKLSLFPKNMKKFIFTEKPIEKNHLIGATVMTRKPFFMPKMFLKNVEHSSYFYKEPVTRRPLMKSKKFTIELTTARSQYLETTIHKYSKAQLFNDNDELVDRITHEELSNEKGDDKKGNTQMDTGITNENSKEHIKITTDKKFGDSGNNKLKQIERLKIDIKTTQMNQYKSTTKSVINEVIDTQSSKPNVTNTNVEKNNEDNISEIKINTDTINPELEKIAEVESKRLKRDKNYKNIGATTNSYETEEKNDLKQFIFVKSMVATQNPTRNTKLEETTFDSIDATIDSIDTIKPRMKRSVNVIEEENLGTTISGFKFTGHESRLTNDLTYKNINS